MPLSNQDTQSRAFHCLKHVAIGDAFGESFFGQTNTILAAIKERKMPDTTWEFTDDTIMSASVYSVLQSFNLINPEKLALAFARNYERDPRRGYGATAASMLRNPDFPKNWQLMTTAVFDGMGSMGNGAAMRSGPVGAFFYNDLEAVKANARKSAIVTHANKEAVVGAQAVAVATALATRIGTGDLTIDATDFIKAVVAELDDSDTRAKINKSLSVPYSYTIDTVRTILGDGTRMLSQDTVPFALWCAAHNLHNFEEAMWKAVSMLGDRDTICAIVGGIVGMSAGPKTVPETWKENVEPVQQSPFIQPVV